MGEVRVTIKSAFGLKPGIGKEKSGDVDREGKARTEVGASAWQRVSIWGCDVMNFWFWWPTKESGLIYIVGESRSLLSNQGKENKTIFSSELLECILLRITTCG